MEVVVSIEVLEGWLGTILAVKQIAVWFRLICPLFAFLFSKFLSLLEENRSNWSLGGTKLEGSTEFRKNQSNFVILQTSSFNITEN